MTKNTGDLISREALIKWIDDSVSQYGGTYSTDMLNMWGLFKDYLINNAPTVEPEELKPLVDKIVEVLPELTDIIIMELPKMVNGIIKCSECSYYTNTFDYIPRPQGEWIVSEDSIFGNFKKCSNCNEEAEWLDGGSQFLSNFCPNCGASMKEGGAE